MRFSLRTFLIVFTCVALFFGLVMRPVLRRGQNRKRIYVHGGQVHTLLPGEGAYWDLMSRFFDNRYIYGPRSVTFDGTEASDQDLAFLARCETIASLSLQSSDVHDDLVRRLAQMPCLESLNLSDTRITDRALDYLEGKELKKLELAATNVSQERARSFQQSNEGVWVSWSPPVPVDEREVLRELQRSLCHWVRFSSVRADSTQQPESSYDLSTHSPDDDLDSLHLLSELKQLKRYELSGMVSADACEMLGRLSDVEELYVDRGYFDNVRWLSGWKKLEALWWYESQVTNRDWRCLGHLPILEKLTLRWPSLNDADFAHVPAGQPLTELTMWNVEITNKSVSHISTLQHLKRLSLDDTGIDATGHKQLHEALPKAMTFLVNEDLFDSTKRSTE